MADVQDLDEMLEALYVVNKHAKKYAEQGTKRYENGKKIAAKRNSIRKETLYTLKSRVLQEIWHKAETVSIHVIDGREFYCLDFVEWSFHAPKSELSIPTNRVEAHEILSNFTSSAEKTASTRSLKDVLLFFEKAFDFNANQFLPQQYVYYGGRRSFVGWTYIPEHTSNINITSGSSSRKRHVEEQTVQTQL